MKYISNEGNPNGGADLVINMLHKKNIIEFFNKKLGTRSPRAKYSYGEGIVSWYISKCCGARRIENMNDYQYDLKKHSKYKLGMSPDSLLYMLKELAVKSTRQKKGKITEKLAKQIEKGKGFDYHQINVNPIMCDLLIETALELGLLNKTKSYILDFDVSEIINKIKGSRAFYKGNGKTAYAPAAAMIENIPVYIENRNGDSNASFNLTQTIEKVLDLLKSKGIKVSIIRIDSAAFSKEFTDFINKSGLKYVTRAKSTSVKSQKEFIRNWEETAINSLTNDVGDTVYEFGNYETRMVMKKVIVSKTNKVKYWAVITNDFDSSNKDILDLYALRGDAENLFSSLNEFGWNLPPMRTFENNTVFLYVTALSYILFRFATRLISENFQKIKETSKLKTFTDKFIRVITYWIKGKVIINERRAKEFTGLIDYT